ncbi:MAG: NUDIX domain-containing protein, partial [Chitinophagales bacterium]|nr:NUDIX domain-containing protein [Chitinophagales bacterium]
MPIRNIAICILKNNKNQILFQIVEDREKMFLRCPGGGIEFGETALEAIQREIKEELHTDLIDAQQIGIIESFFEFNGQSLHEIVFIFMGEINDESLFEKEHFELIESNGQIYKAIWKSLKECQEEGWSIVPK